MQVALMGCSKTSITESGKFVKFIWVLKNYKCMGFLNKLFGGGNSNDGSKNLTKTAELLDEELFWTIVQESLDATNNQDKQEKFLIKRLQKLSPIEIIGFRLRTDKLLYDTYSSEMWCAAYIMNGGCSDDGFEYFRNWVISRGKTVYLEAKNNPDTLIAQVSHEIESYQFENFWYVALEAFEKKTGEQLYDYIDNENLKEGQFPQFEFTWEEEKPESMKLVCPRLFAKMWK
jgi:Protein of unknown function (DUF4240)